MDTSAYPGKGLSLSQLVFALNQELKHTEYPSSFTLDAVSQLEQDISTALVTVREWMNTLVPINRIPPEILCLIPTHLSSYKDRFHASSVCRYWRESFLQHGAPWSELYLRYGKDYVTTLLKRAKGSALDIITERNISLETIALLSPYARQIRSLNFLYNYWADISTFHQILSGPLPLLRTLKICIGGFTNREDQHNLPPLPSSPLFGSAIDLEEFVLDSRCGGSLDHFVFPNLTTFKLFALELNASYLFNFLTASPMLRTVGLTINRGTIPGSIPPDIVVILPNVETFSLSVNGDVRSAYELAVHISCPRAKDTLLTHQIHEYDLKLDLDVFPKSASWVAIARQYTSPVEEVTLEMDCYQSGVLIACSLTFQSSDATFIKLGFQVDCADEEVGGPYRLCEMMNRQIFFQACRAIQGHPLLSHVKRLHFKVQTKYWGVDYLIPMSDAVQELFRSLGPLDELTIHVFDLRIFLAPFIDLPEFWHFERVFPSVKVLAISETRMFEERQGVNGMVELVKSHHEQGKPFERVTVRAREIPTTTAERLRQWVNAVDCSEP